MANVSGKAASKNYSPHIHGPYRLERIMWDVVIALTPILIASVIFFGYQSVRLILISVITSILTEAILCLLMRRPITLLDGSAMITALLFAFNLPPSVPGYVVVIGAFFAIAIVKWTFGGLGHNFMNPALGGRIFIMAAWSSWLFGHFSPNILQFLDQGQTLAQASQSIVTIDAISTASPLNTLKIDGMETAKALGYFNYFQLFIGNIPGSIGETSKAAILIGYGYLVFRKVVSVTIPITILSSVFLLSWILGGLPLGTGFFHGDPLFHLLSGGLILGACFMATDTITSPLNISGKIIFGIGIGLITVLIRIFGGYPEGVCYAIVLMNIFVPLIDRYCKPRIYGYKLKKGS